MNWNRGTLRLVIVASICWTGLVAWVSYQDFITKSTAIEAQSAAQEACVAARTANPSLGNLFACYHADVISDVPPVQTWLSILKLLIIPIAAAFLGWFVMGWVFSGFRPR
jgi:hypothetical protein